MLVQRKALDVVAGVLHAGVQLVACVLIVGVSCVGHHALQGGLQALVVSEASRGVEVGVGVADGSVARAGAVCPEVPPARVGQAEPVAGGQPADGLVVALHLRLLISIVPAAREFRRFGKGVWAEVKLWQ